MKKFVLTLLSGALLLLVSCTPSPVPADTPTPTATPTAAPTPTITILPNPTQTATPAYQSIAQAFEQVLLGARTIQYTDQNRNEVYQGECYLDEVSPDGLTISTFAVVDMDGDGVPEVVCEWSAYIGFVILRYVDGEIYGYDVPYRGMKMLTKDGYSSASGGASETFIGKIRFLDRYYDREEELCAAYEKYYYHEEEINSDTFLALEETVYEGAELTWYDCTKDTVRQELPQQFSLYNIPTPEDFQLTEMQTYLDTLQDVVALSYSEPYYPQAIYDGWNGAMEDIYALCLEKFERAEKDTLIAEQERWLANRETRFQAFEQPHENAYFRDMTKHRAYQLISLYFGDTFYLWDAG